MLRVRNLTDIEFTTVNSAQTSFGAISPGAVTSYKLLENVIAYPGAAIQTGQLTIYAGLYFYCGTPPIPLLEKGKYTLEVYKDPTQFYGYNCRFVMD